LQDPLSFAFHRMSVTAFGAENHPFLITIVYYATQAAHSYIHKTLKPLKKHKKDKLLILREHKT